MGSPLRLGALEAQHRERVAEILRATAVFGESEIAVAMEVFDEGIRGPGSGVRQRDEASGGEGTSHMRESVQSSLTPDPGSPTPPYLFLAAFAADDSLVGYACFGETPSTDRTWDLYWIAVDPAAQGTGGGSLLLAEVERRLREWNARMLVVETSSRPDYAPTRRFYEGRGYGEAARLEDFYAPADDRVIYTKRFLAPHAGAESSR